jgi:3'-phosphoadenosine 5'-phosphosulfate (PAPS) 3'-phosphatase
MEPVFAKSRHAAELDFMFGIIREAGRLLLGWKAAGTEVAFKADNSVVTAADHACAAFLDGHIAERFPGDAILNEETWQKEGAHSHWREAERCWILDPLDSTSSFIRDGQHYGIILGLTVDGKPEVGMTYKPELGELYWAAKGEGAWRGFTGSDAGPLQALPAKVNAEGKLNLILSHGRQSPELHALLVRLGNPAWHRMNGSLKINEVARGEYSAFVSPPENPMNLWDLAATQVILEEAGGRLTDLSGAPLDYRAADPQVNAGVIASNGVTHKVILERLARSAP